MILDLVTELCTTISKSHITSAKFTSSASHYIDSQVWLHTFYNCFRHTQCLPSFLFASNYPCTKIAFWQIAAVVGPHINTTYTWLQLDLMWRMLRVFLPVTDMFISVNACATCRSCQQFVHSEHLAWQSCHESKIHTKYARLWSNIAPG